MAQPLKPTTKSSHAGKARKPPMLELEAEKQKTPEAEPIAFDTRQEISMPQSRQDDKIAGTKTAKPKNTGAEASADRQKASESSQKSTAKETSENSLPQKRGSGGLLVSGITGGVVALLLGAGLQWFEILPSLSHQNNALQSQLKDLQNEMANLQQKTVEGAVVTTELSSDDRKTLDNVVTTIGELNAKNKELSQQLSDVIDNVEVLNNVVNSFGTDNANPQASDVLVKKLNAVDDKLQSLSLLSDKTEESLRLSQENAKNIGVLDKQLEDVAIELKTPIQGKEIAAITAANALKNAIDRGGSYQNELKVLQTIAPDITSLDDLKQSADKGVPNQAELSAEFAHIADQIAATENRAAADATFGQKLWAGVKGLVSSRPIGNVDGNSAAAIAARMEEAIKKGDNERALSEWQTLPQDAKDVSADFVKKLMLRRDADSVLSEVLSDLTSVPTSQKFD